MKKKSVLLLSALLALSVGIVGATACGEHRHSLKDVPFRDATCTHQGRLAHQECTGCHKYFINGKEVGESELVIAKDKTKHVLSNIEYKAATCVDEGTTAHQECSECGNYFVDGVVVSSQATILEIDPDAHNIQHLAEIAATCGANGMMEHDECVHCHKIYKDSVEVDGTEYVIPMGGEHTFVGDAIECSNCDAYKLLCDGDYYVIDTNNLKTFVTGTVGTDYSASPAATKNQALADHVANPMTFGTQRNSGITAANEDGTAWVLTNGTAGDVSSFTRFVAGKPGATAGYVGRYVFTFDVTASDNTAFSRFGVEVVSNTASAIAGAANSKLIGSNANADPRFTEFKAGTTYRFAYLAETTAANQITQIYGCFTGVSSVSISNLHIEFIDGDTTGTPGARLIYAGETEGVKIAADECTHENAFAVAGTATCTQLGTLDHDHCPQCGKDLIDGVVTEDIMSTSTKHTLTEHDAVEATCYTRGNVAYSSCSVCGKLFLANGTEIAEGSLFTMKEHAFDLNGACTNDGCSAHRTDIVVPEGCFGSQGSTINPILVENPGKWAAQTSDGDKASVDGGVLKIAIPSHNTDKKKTAFVRIIPSQDGTTAYVGTYVWTFDFKVTAGLGSAASGTDANIYVGFFIQSTTESGNLGTIADVATKFTIGQTYRFSVLVETLNANQFVQFNIRNVAGSGANIEISNATYKFLSEENTNANRLSSLTFAEEHTIVADTAVDAVFAEDKRYYVA